MKRRKTVTGVCVSGKNKHAFYCFSNTRKHLNMSGNGALKTKGSDPYDLVRTLIRLPCNVRCLIGIRSSSEHARDPQLGPGKKKEVIQYGKRRCRANHQWQKTDKEMHQWDAPRAEECMKIRNANVLEREVKKGCFACKLQSAQGNLMWWRQKYLCHKPKYSISIKSWSKDSYQLWSFIREMQLFQ